MAAQESALVAVGIVNQPDGLAERNGLCIRKVCISRIAVTQRAQQEGGIHLRRARLQRLKGGCGCTGGQAIFVQILHIGLLPALQIGEWRGVFQFFGFLLLAEQANQHGRRFGTCRCTIQFIPRICPLKQAKGFQLVGIMVIVGGSGHYQ